MRNVAEFTLIGRLGAIKKVGSTLRLSIASNYSYKDAGGEWRDDAHWNEITIFSKATIKYVEQHLAKGDLVHARGRVRQNSYDRDDGQRVYTVDLICTDFSRLAQASDNRDDAEPRDAEQREYA
ncbi:MAG: single-stranded DNA-binding protein [Methylocystis silviterrae]|uniref:single-stranded DNA-binding protein n=1 Tax=Methylocystis TaxID=133 RepID=UPI0025FEFE93|nr:single-stranded DNA-binding protein [Methylocystis sp.]